MNGRLDEQKRRNSDSRDAWERFGPHRERVTRLLLDAGSAGGRLCVLGAGNGNDLDLPRLTERFDEVHLVDWDAAALEAGVARAVARAPELDAAKIKLHGGGDLSGIGALTSADPDAMIAAATNASPVVSWSFEVTASVCTLSQLIELGAKTIGPQHPRLAELIFAIRARHLRMLGELTRPSGAAVLITDLVSTDTAPRLAAVAEAQFPAFVAGLLRQRNFFTGLNPLALATAWRDDPQIARVDLLPPWLWDLGPRQYAVYAAVARRTDNIVEG